MQKSSNTYLKIHSHYFYTNYLKEHTGYQTFERLNVDSEWESGTSFTKKACQRSLMNTDKDSSQENAKIINVLTKYVPVLLHKCNIYLENNLNLT